jgi:hypothetical protein
MKLRPSGLVTLLAVGCAAPPPARPASRPPPPATTPLPSPPAPTHPAAPVGVASYATPPPSDAHYDRARAYARDGQFPRAAEELTQVFEEDFIGMRAQAAAEADLQRFWASAEGRALAGRKDEYEARYREVIARGLRVVARSAGMFGGPPRYLRVGIFDPQTRRFVATAPALPGAIYAFVPPNLPYAVVVTGVRRHVIHHVPGKPDETWQSLDTITAFPFDPSGVPVARLDLGHVDTDRASLLLADAKLELDLHAPTDLAPPHLHDARYQLTFGKPVSRDLLTERPLPTERYDPLAVHIDVGYNDSSGVTMAASDARYVYQRASTTGDADALVFPTGESVPIPELLGFHKIAPRVIADATGEHAVLLWDTGADPCGHSVPGRYKVILVTRTSATVTYLGEDEGAAAAAFDGTGALYVQRANGISQVDLHTLHETGLPGLFELSPRTFVPDHCVKQGF